MSMPACIIDLYPYEGGAFQITSMQGILRSCRIRKSINGTEPGGFELVLAPGGPHGPNAAPQWPSLFSSMSLTVIAMEREGRSHIVMIGFVRSCWENEVWEHGRPVQREVHVIGADFSYIFFQPNFYAQLAMFSYAAMFGTDAALGATMELGMAPAPLARVGKTWFEKVMAGEKGLLSKMNFGYYQDTRVTFNELMATNFVEYPGLGLTIPVAQNFAVMSSTWMSTFQNLFPVPWYECFVSTAEENAYGQPPAQTTIRSSLDRCPPAMPCLIARPTPFPTLINPSEPFELDTSLWDALPTHTLDTLGSFNRQAEWDESGVKNFYMILPTPIGSLVGAGNSNNFGYLQMFGVWLNSASLARYGYRPFTANPPWFADPTGDFSRTVQSQGGLDVLRKAVGTLALKAASYFEPMPQMVSGRVQTNLRPDIIPGTRLQYGLSRDFKPWLFYIDSLEHSFVFGGASVTTLSLVRGLPAEVYADRNLMIGLLSGNAMVREGRLQVGLPRGSGPPLRRLDLTESSMGLVTEIGPGPYGAPGMK